jgi:selenocysteine-specific elongation factor
MLLGTAGHIDHGKTALVRALTGIDTDRLPEEKRRGITLELGFAHLLLPNGEVAGVVDVPGHERFVKAMAAGAGGIDTVLLVISLEGGVMPQTREHLDICRLLGVERGVIVLTKADLAGMLGSEWVGLIRADVAALVKDTFLEHAEVISCSSKSGEGLDALRSALARLGPPVRTRSPEGPLLLPLDRSFSLKGFGTVVTGSLYSGTLRVEEPLALLRPDGVVGPLRIRGLQVHGQPSKAVTAGHRAAVNLPEVLPREVPRGAALARWGELSPARMLDVLLEVLSSAEKPLRHRQKLLLHLGTAVTEATVALPDGVEALPGTTVAAQLRLAASVPALVGQRFILRGFQVVAGRGATVAGGEVLSTVQRRRRRGSAASAAPPLAGDARLLWLLEQSGWWGASVSALAVGAGLPARVAERALELAATRGEALLVDRDPRRYLSGRAFEGLRQKLSSAVAPGEAVPKEALRTTLSQNLEPRLFARVLAAEVEAGTLVLVGESVARGGLSAPVVSSDDLAQRAALLELLRKSGLAPPELAGLGARLGGWLPSVVLGHLKALEASGQVSKVSETLYFHRDAVVALQDRLVDHLKTHGGISTQAFKALVGQTRKYVIPLSEFFDRERITLRVGEQRVLRRGTV